jgi:ABC-type Fe3+/spermidine/putrescine transport system ATPase subunit
VSLEATRLSELSSLLTNPVTDAVELKDVSKAYAGQQVLRNISLVVRAGEMFGVLGPSGCGKTTLLKVIAGLEQHNAGVVRLRGIVMNDVPVDRRNIGLVFQSYALFPHLTVFDNVAFGLQERRVPRANQRERVKEMLRLVQLPGIEARYPRQLSGGQQQRVAIARALAIRPDVLLLDEPLSNLDAKLRLKMRDELRSIQRQTQVTTVLVTHDQEEALSICDRVVVLDRGDILQIGSPMEIYDRPTSRAVAEFVGHANLLNGTVERCQGGVAIVRTQLGSVRCTAPTPSRAGSPGCVMIRPERVRLGVAPEDVENRFAGVVLNRMRVGPTMRVQLLVREVELEATVPFDGKFVGIEDDVVVGWGETDALLLPSDE